MNVFVKTCVVESKKGGVEEFLTKSGPNKVFVKADTQVFMFANLFHSTLTFLNGTLPE